MFLRRQLGDHLSELVTVDINPEMIKIAKEFFGFQEDEKLKSVIGDAYDYVSKGCTEKFDIVIMDINYEEEDTGISPPVKFLQKNFLHKLLVSYWIKLTLCFRNWSQTVDTSH